MLMSILQTEITGKRHEKLAKNEKNNNPLKTKRILLEVPTLKLSWGRDFTLTCQMGLRFAPPCPPVIHANGYNKFTE